MEQVSLTLKTLNNTVTKFSGFLLLYLIFYKSLSFWLRQGAQGVTLSVRPAQSALKH